MIMRYTASACMAILALAVAGSQTTQAQEICDGGTIRIVSPYSAGGTSDFMARTIADALSDSLGQTVIVENHPGAGGVLGSDVVARAPADGCTFLWGSITTHSLAPILQENVPYDPLADFTPVALVATAPSLLVVEPSSAIQSVEDLISTAKQSSGTLDYGSAGIGSIAHLTTEAFLNEAGIDMQHIPYQGDAPALADLMGGHIDVMFGAIPSVMSMVQSGTLRPIAVSSAERSPIVPDIPTVAESGLPGFEVVSWWMMFAPADLPDDKLNRINEAVVQALQSEAVIEGFRSRGVEPEGSKPEEASELLRSQFGKWSAELPELGISAN